MFSLHLPPFTQGVGLSVVLALGLVAQSSAQVYPPYGPDIPVITNTEPQSGALNQDREKEPAPNPWNEESIWNMRVEGYNDNQARPIYQPLIVNQNGREILYAGNLAGTALNPLTGVQESNGTSIIDVTDVKKPKFLYHIPGPAPIAGSYAAAGAQMARVCGGNTLPNAAANGTAGHWYLLRAFGNAGPDESHQIWDVTDPAAPKFVVTVISGLSNTHKSWWECDTGIAYLVAGSKSDHWQQSGSTQHRCISVSSGSWASSRVPRSPRRNPVRPRRAIPATRERRIRRAAFTGQSRWGRPSIGCIYPTA